ncbi:MAG: DUF4091 domain-containing protein [Rhodopirellula sp.]|nr:DUF4091 domain-containing protein [Rhodopirellula sp.]
MSFLIDHKASFVLISAVLLQVLPSPAMAQENLLANPGFESLSDGFFPAWNEGRSALVGKVLFTDSKEAPQGSHCLRMIGTPGTWTTCAAKVLTVQPETDYWITWSFKGKQPASSRTYLFLQTNLAQRVFPHTDQNGDFGWTHNLVKYRTAPGETTISPVLTMQTAHEPPGTSWWDEIGVWQKLPPELEAEYRRQHPWDDVRDETARRHAATDTCLVWGDYPEARIYPTTAPPDDGTPAAIELAAAGRGHAIHQLVVTPKRSMQSVTLRFRQPTGPGPMPPASLGYRAVRCVPVQQVRNKAFPLGPTPDPLVPLDQPEPVRLGENTIFWIEWAPPAESKPGDYLTRIEVLGDGRVLAEVPMRLRRWAFDLPEIPHFRSMVLVPGAAIRQFYPRLSEEEALQMAWQPLGDHRLSGFNIALWPTVRRKEGKLEIDWTRFDRLVAAAKQQRATAITLGPMLGGGAGQGWKPHPFAGLTPLADSQFDSLYVDMNRRMAQRLRQAGLLERAYVYPYDEPEPDYMDKIARLCDLIHQGDPELKCLMTVAPQIAEPLWGKVDAWIVPSGSIRREVIDERRAAGDEIWIYNMTAAIEESPLDHRLYMWRALGLDAAGALLWNCCWWHKIDPWENPTAASYSVGRNQESLYHYQAGQASLFYPDPAGKAPLVPALRLPLIRQGVEDFDLLTELLQAWQEGLAELLPEARRHETLSQARQALLAPVLLGAATATTSPARTDAVRRLAGSELEVARTRPVVIAYPTRVEGRFATAGWVEPGATLIRNGTSVPVDADGCFAVVLSQEELADGLCWTAQRGPDRKTWEWPGIR